MVVGGQRHATAALPPGKTRYPLYRGLGVPQGRTGRVRQMPLPGIELRTVKPITSRYTDCAIPAYLYKIEMGVIRQPPVHGKLLAILTSSSYNAVRKTSGHSLGTF
jgi:hypothetical protein